MELKEMLRKLDEKFANGEITEETYKEIKARYEAEPPGDGDHGHGGGPGSHRGHRRGAGHCGMHGFGDFGLGRVSKEEREDGLYVTISGVNDYEGDLKAKEVIVSGTADVNGNVEADRVKVSGACDIGGSVKAKESFVASGACDIAGDVEADVIEIRGACEIAGSARARLFKASGSSDVGKDVTADDCHVSGACDVGGTVKARAVVTSGACDFGSVDADEFDGRGAFDVGHLKAVKVTLSMADKCVVGKIEAGRLEARPRQAGGRLISERITVSESAYLENVTAEIVTGPKVEVGPGCEIVTIESPDAKVDPSSKVGEVTKPSQRRKE